jgi:hypothetical protein
MDGAPARGQRRSDAVPTGSVRSSTGYDKDRVGTFHTESNRQLHPSSCNPSANSRRPRALLLRHISNKDIAYGETHYLVSLPSFKHYALYSVHAADSISFQSRALRSWTSLWQQTPESILDPNNESGPIPFTSSALLVVAYIRLSLDLGSHRHLESRDPDVVAGALAQLPEIERDDNLLSALLYSTHALSIPVRLGIDRVARSQAFFWSVQHAISSFECAIFLGKWLCSLPDPLEEGSLSREFAWLSEGSVCMANVLLLGSEYRILHWVRCIIQEAYTVVDFDSPEEGEDELAVPNEPYQLGFAVLKIWCRFFQGNTQWQFVVNLGLSLERYMKILR